MSGHNVGSREWWSAALQRAVRTMAQTVIATIGSTALLTEVDWAVVLSATLLAGVLSVMTSLSGLPEVPEQPAIEPAPEVDATPPPEDYSPRYRQE